MNAREAVCRRPSIPLALWVAVAMAAGCVLGESATWSVSAASRWWPIAGGAAAALGSLIWARRSRSGAASVLALLTVGALVGTAASVMQGLRWEQQLEVAAHAGAREWRGTVVADPTPGSFGTTVYMRLDGGALPGARIRVSWPDRKAIPELGQTVAIRAVLRPLSREEQWSRRAARGGVCAVANPWRVQKGDWPDSLKGRLLVWRARALTWAGEVNGPGGDLLSGIVLGDRRRLLGTAVDEDFRVLGLTHLVAVSGSHLALACGAVALIGRAVRVPKRPLGLLTAGAGLAYTIVTGMAYSAVRSLLMIAAGLLAEWSGVRRDGLGALALALMALLLAEPWSVFDVGLQLSGLAVLGLLLFGELATTWAVTASGSRGKALVAPLALTCVAQAMTAPVMAGVFGSMSVVAPLANAGAAAPISVGLWLGLAGALLRGVWPWLGRVLLNLTGAVFSTCAAAARAGAAIPGASVLVPSSIAIVLAVIGAAGYVWTRWPLPQRRQARRGVAGVVLASVMLAVWPFGGRAPSVAVLDVGQGDAILIRDSGRTMLVDAGPSVTALRKALGRHGVRRIDALVLTHDHADHTAGIDGLTGLVDVGWVGVSSADDVPSGIAGEFGGDVRQLRAGDSWRVGGMSVTVLSPRLDAPGDLSTNNTSVVLRVVRGPFEVALTGDAEGGILDPLAEEGRLAAVDVLKVPHHGSSNGLTPTALEAWSPDIALVSVGEGNDFGHPAATTMAALAAARVRSWRTDQVGDITVEPGTGAVYVRVQRRGRGAATYGRIERLGPRSMALAPAGEERSGEPRGGQEHRRTEACLLDLRERGSAARARGPPAA